MGQDEFICSFIHNFILYDFFKIPPNVSRKDEFGIYLILAYWEQVAFFITQPTSSKVLSHMNLGPKGTTVRSRRVKYCPGKPHSECLYLLEQRAGFGFLLFSALSQDYHWLKQAQCFLIKYVLQITN